MYIKHCFNPIYSSFCSIYYLLLFTHNLQCEDCNYFCTVAKWMGTKAPPSLACESSVDWWALASEPTSRGPDRSGHRVHRVAMAAFWRTFHHEGKISPGWRGGGWTPTPFHYISSQVKLQCTLQLSGQIRYPVSSLVKVCTLWVRICWWGNSWKNRVNNL